MTDKGAMKLALDALQTLMIERGSIYDKAITAIKEQLAQPEQEPVAWLVEFENGEQELHFDEQSVGEIHTPLYTHPPQRAWVALTPEEVKEISLANRPYVVDMVVALEARLKQKNGYDT